MTGDNLGVKRKRVLLNPNSACLLFLVQVVGCCLEPHDLGKEKAGKVRVGGAAVSVDCHGIDVRTS